MLIVATILIVDDRAVNREFLVTLLGYGDHRLLQAGDGAEALAVARAEQPDLVIADVLMPTMDGYELVRQLRADSRLAQTRVIFWTAHYHEKEAKALARDCGVSAVITKPAEPEDVLRAVESALDTTPSVAELPPPDEFDREHLRLLTDKISRNADDLRATNERLSALIDLNLQLASELDLQRLIQTFGRAARQIVGARYSITGVLDGDGTRFQSLFTSGMDAEMAARIGSQDPDSAPLAAPLREGRSTRLRNAGGDPVAIGFSAALPPIHAWLGAPIASPNRLYGYIGLIDKIGSDEFSAEDERLATILAAQVGRIYQNGSLYSDVLSHAVELEREISARTQTEKALDEREEHIRLLLDSTAEGIYGIDLEGRCTFANSTCARLLGYKDPGQLLGRNMHCLMHHTRPDGSPYPAEECRIFLAFRENQASHVDDEVLWRADGSSFPAEYWSHPICREGRVAGSVVTFLDITERRQLEHQFRQAQQRLRHIIVSSPAVLFTLSILEGEFVLTWISDNLLEVTGYRARDSLGTQWWHTNIHPAERKWVTEQSRDALFAHGESVQGVFSSQVAFLQKPIASADLAQKVRAVLDAEQPPASRS